MTITKRKIKFKISFVLYRNIQTLKSKNPWIFFSFGYVRPVFPEAYWLMTLQEIFNSPPPPRVQGGDKHLF